MLNFSELESNNSNFGLDFGILFLISRIVLDFIQNVLDFLQNVLDFLLNVLDSHFCTRFLIKF